MTMNVVVAGERFARGFFGLRAFRMTAVRLLCRVKRLRPEAGATIARFEDQLTPTSDDEPSGGNH